MKRHRIWDKTLNKMTYPDDNSNCRLHLNGAVTYGNTRRTADVVVMATTGLKDNKRTEEYPDGQEIYEGDIVKTDISYYIANNQNKNYKEGTQVYYTGEDKGKLLYDIFTVEYKKELCGYHPFSKPAFDGYEWENIDYKKVEVIGNIYEHAHLLNE